LAHRAPRLMLRGARVARGFARNGWRQPRRGESPSPVRCTRHQDRRRGLVRLVQARDWLIALGRARMRLAAPGESRSRRPQPKHRPSCARTRPPRAVRKRGRAFEGRRPEERQPAAPPAAWPMAARAVCCWDDGFCASCPEYPQTPDDSPARRDCKVHRQDCAAARLRFRPIGRNGRPSALRRWRSRRRRRTEALFLSLGRG
jgi:hypothetical protein